MFQLIAVLLVLGLIAWILAKLMYFVVVAAVIVVAWVLWKAMGSGGRGF